MVEGRSAEQKQKLDQDLGLDGYGKVDLSDDFIPDELRRALDGQPVPSWWNDKADSASALRQVTGGSSRRR